MRAMVITIVLAAIAVLGGGARVASAQHCQIVGCWRECQPVPGGRWCRKVCRKRCWRPAPRYEPPPNVPRYDYQAPAYVPAPSSPQPGSLLATQSDPTGLIILLGGAIIVVLGIAAVAAGASRPSHGSDILDINADIHKTNELMSALEAAARDADAHIAAAIAKARQGGGRG